MAYSTVVIATSGVQSYWRLGETGGSTAADSVGAITGTYVGPTLNQASLLPADSSDPSASFDATNDAVTFASSAYNFNGTAAFSVEFLVRLTTVAGGTFGYILDKEDHGTRAGWGIFQNGSDIGLEIYSAGAFSAGRYITNLVAGVTYHIVFTASAGTLTAYLNGALAGTNTARTSIPVVANNLRLGTASTGFSYFGGRLDEVAIYNVELSAATVVAHLAESGLGPTFVGAGAAAFTATSSATIAPGLPTGWAANDIHVLIASGNNNLDWPEPAGWTKISPGAVAENNTANMRVEVWVRRAVGGDAAPTLSTYTGTTVRGAQIIGVRGCPTTGTAESHIAAMNRSNNASSVTATFATLTPGQNNTLLVALLAYQDNITAATTLTGFSAFDMAAAQRSALGNDMAVSYAVRHWATGASATGALTSTTSGAAANVNVGILLAFFAPMPALTIDLSALPATATGTAVDPTVTVTGGGNVTVDATASPATAAGTAVNPTVVQASLTLDRSSVVATAVSSAVTPTVTLSGGGVTVNASSVPALAASSAIDPTVRLGSITVNATAVPATASGAAGSPTVQLGSVTINVSALPALATATAIDPTVRQASLTLNLSAVVATATSSAVTPTVTLSGGGVTVNLSASPATAAGSAVTPSVVQSSLVVAPEPASAVASAITPTVVQGSLSVALAALPALAIGTAVTPTITVAAAAARATGQASGRRLLWPITASRVTTASHPSHRVVTRPSLNGRATTRAATSGRVTSAPSMSGSEHQ